jgi:Tfp pilus assembly protein PilO
MNWIIEHKRFTVFVLGALFILLVEYYYFIAGLQSETSDLQEQQYKLRAEIETNVKKGQFLSERSIQNAQEEIKFVENRFSVLRNRINFKPLSGYEIPAMQRPDELNVNFQSLLKDIQKRLEKNAAQKGVPIPAKLEFPLSKVSAETIRLYYERLDILEQMVNLAMDSDCLKIVEWGVSENDFREFREFKEIYFKSQVGAKNLVLIKINGTFGSITRFINRLHSAERFVSLEKMALSNSGPDLDNITAAFIVAGLKLEEPVPPKQAGGTGREK